MVELKSKSSLALIFVLAMASVSVLAVDYSPGVTVGQYVKYGNITYIVNGSQSPVPVNWTRVGVILVSGKNVTLLSSGQFTDGSPIPSDGSISIYDIETGKLNESSDYTYGPIIAGNLSEGDAIPPLSYGFVVNRTETRTYFDTLNRTVNILETTYSDPNYGNHWLLVYDKITGLMLESRIDVSDKTTETTTNTSFSVIETNISGSVVPEFESPLLFVAGTLLTLIVLLFQRKKIAHKKKPFNLKS